MYTFIRNTLSDIIVLTLSHPQRKNFKCLTSTELTYHESSASGRDALDVQFRSTTSPTEYLDFCPVI